ncbi:CAAX protease [Brachybacterium phenoliresistens]|uniref:CAAX protease n=1 Tax=Brachybacterium phenoliresistens TaxID=396014 RepID=Z9JSG7_9MICO|nr:CPBP family intramembrane glutamic endopeptidase [Brachybacterium phenoliresistens]EWS80958.1 CAAX protease [Brachybacterium phenoliresistens]
MDTTQLPTAPETRTPPDAPLVPVLRVVSVLAVRPVLILALGLGLLAAHASLLYANALVVLVDLAALAVLAAALRAEGRSLLDLLRPWRWVDLAWGALMLVILLIGFLASSFVANLLVYGGAPPMPRSMPDIPLWVGLVAVLVAPLTIAVAEEAVYRGYAQPRLARRTGTLLAVLAVAVVFALQHAGFALTSPADVAAKLLATLFAGLILGALMLWTRRIAPLILGHWGLDLLLLGLPTLAIALS